MSQRILCKQIFSRLRRNCWLTQINKLSNDPTKTVNNIDKTSDIDEFQENSSNPKYSKKEVIHLLNQATMLEDIKNNSWMTSPYPEDASLSRKKTREYIFHPNDTSVMLFPGQGTIKVGLIKKYIDIPDAKDLFEIANEILNYNLLNLCLHGPQEKLNMTKYNQVATVVSSLAALEYIRAENPKVFETCVSTAGYSVGEITALIFAGAITYEDGIRLAWTRGQAMQEAANRVPQGMLSITCTHTANVHKACADAKQWAIDVGVEDPFCGIAIYLHTEKKILAGHLKALEYIERSLKSYGLSNVSRLPVSGAFHTPLMQPALKSVSSFLNTIELSEPRCQVYSNYKGHPYTLHLMRKYILKQIVKPVKWEQCMQSIYSRADGIPFPQTYDVGSQGRMKILLKLINTKASKSCIVI